MIAAPFLRDWLWVQEDSLAATQPQIQVGMELLAINGQSMEGWDFDQVSEPRRLIGPFWPQVWLVWSLSTLKSPLLASHLARLASLLDLL